MADTASELIERQIELWSGIEPPNEAARIMVRQLETTIRSFEALRESVRFEDEPSSFEAALLATKDRE